MFSIPKCVYVIGIKFEEKKTVKELHAFKINEYYTNLYKISQAI